MVLVSSLLLSCTSPKKVATKKRVECGISGTDIKTKTSDKKTITTGSKETSKQIEIDSQKTKVVIATGVGETEHEAIKDAGRSAVKEAVGMFLVSETIVENDELIKDEVLSVSDGFVSKFRTISKGKDEDGLVEVISKGFRDNRNNIESHIFIIYKNHSKYCGFCIFELNLFSFRGSTSFWLFNLKVNASVILNTNNS